MPCSDDCRCYYCTPPQWLKDIRREHQKLEEELRKQRSMTWAMEEAQRMQREIDQMKNGL